MYILEIGFKRTFTNEQEAALYEYIANMEPRLMGLSSTDVRHLAFDFATKLGVEHNFNCEWYVNKIIFLKSCQ